MTNDPLRVFLLAAAPETLPAASVIGYALIAVIILCTVFMSIYFILKTPHDKARYQVLVLLLSFALTATLSMLFYIKSEFSITTADFTFSAGGAGALWLGASVVIIKLLPFDGLFNTPSASEFSDYLRRTELDLGWSPYETWKAEQRVTPKLFAGLAQEEVIRNLLHVTCNHDARPRLSTAEVTTLFIYFDRYVVKVQRILGTNNSMPAFLRVKSNGSFPGDTPRLAFFKSTSAEKTVAIGDNYTDIDQFGTHQYGYEELNTQRVDCLILTRYEDMPKEGEDYLLLELPRFCSATTGVVRIGISTPGRKLKEHDVWTMQHSTAVRRGTIPLIFRQPDYRTDPNLKVIFDHLRPWAQAIDKRLDPNAPPLREDVVAVLNSILPVSDKGVRSSLEALIDVASPSGRQAYLLQKATEVTILLLRME